MSKQKLFLLFVSIILVVYLFLTLKSRKHDVRVTNNSIMQDKKFIAASEIINNDKNFYNISIEKDVSKINKNTQGKNKYFTKIRQILTMKHTDIPKLDKMMVGLLMDKNIKRIDKINGLWFILNEIGFSSDKSEYVLDVLGTLLPIELTDELIDTYQIHKNHSMKKKIIAILANNLSIANPEVQDEERLSFIIEKMQDIQSFIKDKVLSDSNPEILFEGLQAYASISDPEDVYELVTSLKNNNIQISESEFMAVLTEVALGTAESQENMLPDMLNNINNNQVGGKESFDQMMIESLNAGVLTEDTQKEIAIYLSKQEPTLSPNKKGSEENIVKYFEWAEASSKIKNNNIHLENIVLESDNPLKISSVLLYANEKTREKIKSNPNVNDIYAKLESALEDESIDEHAKTVIKDAIGTLQDDLLDTDQ